jgi:predicted amidohydrolase
MDRVRVAAVQFEHVPRDKQANLEKVRLFTEKAAADGVQIAAFPECCITGYWFMRNLPGDEFRALAEPVPEGPSSRFVVDLAKRCRIAVGAGLLELAADGKVYNTYLVALPDGRVHRHRKIHAFENAAVSAGSEYTVFDTPYGCRVGVLICYDNNVIENVRITALMGADILIAPHQTGGCASKNPHQMGRVDRALWDNRKANPAAIEAEFKGDKGRAWLMRWLPSRAHDNGMFLVFANGVGVDDDEVRTGNAMILDPYGRILAETWQADDDMVTADLDPDLLIQCTGRRWIRTRRPDLYKPLTVPTGLEEDVKKVRFDQKGL